MASDDETPEAVETRGGGAGWSGLVGRQTPYAPTALWAQDGENLAEGMC